MMIFNRRKGHNFCTNNPLELFTLMVKSSIKDPRLTNKEIEIAFLRQLSVDEFVKEWFTSQEFDWNEPKERKFSMKNLNDYRNKHQ